MMDIQRIRPGRRMSQAVIHNGTVYLAGQVATGAAGDTVEAQTRDILGSIATLLTEAGSNPSLILSATIWLSDISAFEEMNAVWDAWVLPGAAPVRACVEARLASPLYQVEIAVIAAVRR